MLLRERSRNRVEVLVGCSAQACTPSTRIVLRTLRNRIPPAHISSPPRFLLDLLGQLHASSPIYSSITASSTSLRSTQLHPNFSVSHSSTFHCPMSDRSAHLAKTGHSSRHAVSSRKLLPDSLPQLPHLKVDVRPQIVKLFSSAS